MYIYPYMYGIDCDMYVIFCSSLYLGAGGTGEEGGFITLYHTQSIVEE